MCSYPSVRPRRLRRSPGIRRLVAETKLTVDKLVLPVFVKEGIEEPEEIPSMPSFYRFPLDKVVKHVEEAYNLGIRSFIFFGIPRVKDELGSQAYSDQGIVQRALREVKSVFNKGDVVLITDVCLCQYTDHGHCGIIKSYVGAIPIVDNDSTLKLLALTALSHAEAGADVVAPSAMMDGQVKAIREALDKEGYTDVLIMSYSVKYASSFYGPFREAAYSAPRVGDRRTYQMSIFNAYEALKEVDLDVSEGADILMVKPALTNLDVIRLVKDHYPEYPLAAYSVSGEYAMIKAASKSGFIDEKSAVNELLTSIKRAGADIIITYYALEYAKWVSEGFEVY